MQVTFLTIDEIADLIEQAEKSGHIIEQQRTPGEIVYRIQHGAGERVLINTPFGNYLVGS